jgi:hypothetical protein
MIRVAVQTLDRALDLVRDLGVAACFNRAPSGTRPY